MLRVSTKPQCYCLFGSMKQNIAILLFLFILLQRSNMYLRLNWSLSTKLSRYTLYSHRMQTEAKVLINQPTHRGIWPPVEVEATAVNAQQALGCHDLRSWNHRITQWWKFCNTQSHRKMTTIFLQLVRFWHIFPTRHIKTMKLFLKGKNSRMPIWLPKQWIWI